jgi:hypothetical protein
MLKTYCPEDKAFKEVNKIKKRETDTRDCSIFAMWGHIEKLADCKPGRDTLSETEPLTDFDCGLPSL